MKGLSFDVDLRRWISFQKPHHKLKLNQDRVSKKKRIMSLLGVPIEKGSTYQQAGCSNRHRTILSMYWWFQHKKDQNIYIHGVPIDIEPTYIYTCCFNRHRTKLSIQGVSIDK